MGEGVRVPVTPPGDVRPALRWDVATLNRLLEDRYGVPPVEGCIVLNRLPGRDRVEEVFVDGVRFALLRYDGRWKLSLTPEGASLVLDDIKRGYVIADKGASDSILKGSNLMAPGVVEVAENVKRGDEVVILCGNVVATGVARVSHGEVPVRGVAVKVRKAVTAEKMRRRGRGASWEEAVKANEKALRALEERGIRFVRDVAERHKLPVLVSFSGGKDSMATLLLVMKSGVPFRAFFLNTGIEFPETAEYVESISRKYGLDMDVVSAGDAFWEGLKKFGPPGRDYRWCCKAVKLGPTVRYILERYSGSVLTFIGQRRYESEARMRKGAVWRNEWVPNQIGASPIQNWTALEVFLYLFREGAPINPWYERGLHRIGCYLCPASDMGDLKIVEEHGLLDGWYSYLREYALSRGADERWVRGGVWRWSSPPPWARETDSGEVPALPREGLRVRVVAHGDAVRLVPSRPLNIDRLRNMANVLPPGAMDAETLTVRRDLKGAALQVVHRSENCVGCGICMGRCPAGALYIGEGGKVWVREERCSHCSRCLGPCPAFTFRRR